MRALAFLLVSSTTGCYFPAGPSTSAPSVDEAAILAEVAHGAYKTSPELAAVSQIAYASAIAPANRVDVWVTAGALADYDRIEPDRTGSGATVRPNTLLVREVQDGTGAVVKLTLMMKGPAGYNPSVGDFWFGVTTADGTPMMENGAPQMGHVTACFGCHQQRANDGFLFGVPPSARESLHVDGGVDPGGGPDGGNPDGGGPDGGSHDGGGMHHHGMGDMSHP
jgi:hypothetical protein